MPDSDPTRPMRLEAATLAALGLEPDDASPGNVAAHLYRLAHATARDPLAGINLGWKDQESSTHFLAGIVSAIDEMVAEGNTDTDDLHEVADSAVPYGNNDRLLVVMELGNPDLDDPGLAPANPSLSDLAGVILYEQAYKLASALLGTIAELEGPCLVCGAYDGDHDEGCMAEES